MSTAIKTFKKFSVLLIILTTLIVGACLTAVITFADSYYTVRINYYFKDGSPAHDAYVAAFPRGADVDTTVTNPNIQGFTPMTAAKNGDSAVTTALNYSNLSENKTLNVYYIAGLTKYRAIYYKQNIYDDLYTRDNSLPSTYTDRYGYTGSNPTDLENVDFEGFTNLFHEPDAIAADGSTVFRVYYDRNFYIVNFDLGEGGYGVEPVYAKYQSVYHIAEPERAGYTFRGWVETTDDSSEGTYGEDWYYKDSSGNILKDNDGNPTVDINGQPVEGYNTAVSPVKFNDGTVPAKHTYYKAIWTPATTKYTIMYWIEKPESKLTDADFVGKNEEESHILLTNNFSVASAYDVKNATSGEVLTYEDTVLAHDLFDFDLSDTTNFPTMSSAIRTELINYERYFELNESASRMSFEDNDHSSVTVAGDGSTRINVYYKRADINLKFFYAKTIGGTVTTDANGSKGLTGGTVYLTCGTKNFGVNSQDAANAKADSVLTQVSRTGWGKDVVSNLPTIVKEGLKADYIDDTTSSDSTRYWFYEITAKFGASMQNVWFNDAFAPQQRNDSSDTKEVVRFGSWAVQEGSRYKIDKTNFTVKGFFEKLQDKVLLTETFIDYNIKNTPGFDFKQLYFAASWMNTGKLNGNDWNDGAKRVYNFTYKNYTQLLPCEDYVIQEKGVENFLKGCDYPAGVYSGNNMHFDKGHWSNRNDDNSIRYIDVIENNGKRYGLKSDNIIETYDAGSQYGGANSLKNEPDLTQNVRENQTAVSLTGYTYITNDILNPANTSQYMQQAAAIHKTYTHYYLSGNSLETDTVRLECRDWTNYSNATSKEKTQMATLSNWYDADGANNGFDQYHHADIMHFYTFNTYALNYYNYNETIHATSPRAPYDGPFNAAPLRLENPTYPVSGLENYYEFKGWYWTPYYLKQLDYSTDRMPASDTTFYAKWEPKKLKVSFYPTYNAYYESIHNDNVNERIHCFENPKYDENNPTAYPKWIDGDIIVQYGKYVPQNQVPIDNDDPLNPNPILDPPAEGAMFAGWYYLRDNVPVRFEPEKVPVTALNQDAAENGELKLYAEWVTKDVAKYKINYVEKGHPENEVADPTTGRSFVYKTKTFNAKCGDQLNASHAWEEDGVNWWPTINSHSLVIKSNEQGKIYAPNEHTFEYIQKPSVHYKIQYLAATTRAPLKEEVILSSTHASVQSDAPFIAGYVATEATKTLVLSASTKEAAEKQEAEELENNVITFYYNKNDTEYLYEVEYYKQNVNDNGYSLLQKEQLTVPIASEGDTKISLQNNIYNRQLPQLFVVNGCTRKPGATTVTETNDEGTNTYSVADNAEITISSACRTKIKVYFDRNTYNYSYTYVDRTAEEAYNKKLANGESVDGVWNGVIQEFPNQGPERVEKEVTINSDRDLTYNGIPYTKIGTNDVMVTIAPITENNPNVNSVKVYYRKFTERELQFKLSCKNENSPYTEVDYDDTTHDPLYGGLSNPLQTVDKFADINSVTFYNYNNATVTGISGVESYIHNHKYTFLGWYDNPEGTGTPLTTNETLTKDDISPTGDLPARDSTYYAVVEQVLVQANFEFRLIDEDLPANDNDAAQVVRNATPDPNGDMTGCYFDFTAPSTYQNNTPIPWHRTDSYSMSIESKDSRAYKYEFVEWWEEDFERGGAYVRHHNWNQSQEGWSPTSLQNQVTRNGNKHIIAVYKKRAVTEMPYTINYHFKTRLHGEKDYVVKGTLSGDDLNEKKWIVNSWADAAPPTSPEGTNTVKFINKNNWDKVYLYAWDDDDENAQWPGVELTDKTTNESGEEVFTGTFNSNYTKLIFTNGSDETVDITYNSSVTGYYPVQKTALINTSGAYELTDNFIMSQAPYESNHGETLCWKDTNIVKTSEKGNSTAKSETAQTDRIITTVTAEQKVKKAYANYKIYPNQSFTSLQTEVGANRATDEKLGVIDATGLTYEGKNFSYWEIRKSDSANAKVVARCYEPWFSFCIMDNYYITPVYDDGGKSASLDPSKLQQNNEDWYAWTWNEGENGVWVTPTNGLTFQGLKDKVIFVRVKEGSGVPPTTWSISGDIWNQTSDLDVVNGGTYTVSGYSGTTMLGSWFNIKLTHLDYSRNRWTDNNGAIPSDGSTDELFTDFEIAFNNQFEAIHGENTGYKTGVVFELCAQLPDGVTFDQDKDYKAVSNEDNLKAKIKSSLESNTYYTTYSYKTNKNRNIQIKEIPTGNLTNKNRIQFGQGYVNKYTVTGTDESGNEIRKYTNSTYLLKAWAYLIDSDGNVTLSNPVYTCLNNISKKDFASGEAIGDVNMVNYTSGN